MLGGLRSLQVCGSRFAPRSFVLDAGRLSVQTPFFITQKRTLFHPQKHRFNEEHMDCLAPFMSEKSFERHFQTVYLQGYKKLNALVQTTPYLDLVDVHRVVQLSSAHQGDIEIFNAAADIRNHQVFFDTLVPWNYSDADKSLSKNTRRELYVQFGGLEPFKIEFMRQAKNFKGSGWLWLVNRDSHLEIMPTYNNATPEVLDERIIPIFCLDLWEHSFVDDYGANIEAYVDSFWHVLNWEKVEERCMFARRMMLFLTDRTED